MKCVYQGSNYRSGNCSCLSDDCRIVKKVWRFKILSSGSGCGEARSTLKLSRQVITVHFKRSLSVCSRDDKSQAGTLCMHSLGLTFRRVPSHTFVTFTHFNSTQSQAFPLQLVIMSTPHLHHHQPPPLRKCPPFLHLDVPLPKKPVHRAAPI